MSSVHKIKTFLFSILSTGSGTAAAEPAVATPAPTSPAPYDQLALDAFAIADQSMIDTLRAQCICQDPEGTRLWPVSPTGMKVQTIAEACPKILNALAWCRQRGMVNIETTGWDELIVLKTSARC